MKPKYMDRSLSFSSRIQKIAGTTALMALAFTACTQGDELSHNPGGDTPGLLTVSVSQGGYAENGTPATRTVENGYQTEFQAGDCIGVFVERTTDGGVTHTCENVKLTYDGSAWTGPLYYYTTKDASHSVTYTAYYPYCDAGFADGADFQAWVDAFTPPTDQSTHALYTAADLMTATGAVSGGNISFRLVHRMALCVAKLPGMKYTLTDAGGNSLPDYYIPVPGIQFNGFRPYHHADGEYRYLVKPGTATPLSGSYRDAAGATKEYTLDPSGITASGYKRYKIDGGVTTKTHTLQAGDYYMKDGSLMPGTPRPPDNRKPDVLGIVFWVGDPTNTVSGDPALRREHPHCTHGLVVALKDLIIVKTRWQTAWTDIGSWMNANPTGYENITTGTGDNDNSQKIIGYNNTKAIDLYNEYCDSQGGMNNKKVLPALYVTDYATAHPAPAGSSGWYLPSIKELSTLCSGWYNGNIWNYSSLSTRDLVNNKLRPLGASVAEEIKKSYYWSSSENADDLVSAFGMDCYRGRITPGSKIYSQYWGRAVLAF